MQDQVLSIFNRSASSHCQGSMSAKAVLLRSMAMLITPLIGWDVRVFFGVVDMLARSQASACMTWREEERETLMRL